MEEIYFGVAMKSYGRKDFNGKGVFGTENFIVEFILWEKSIMGEKLWEKNL